MKRFIKILSVVSFGAMICACNGEQLDIEGETMPDPGPEVIPEATLTLSQTEVTIGGSLYDQGETTLQTNQTVFNATSSASWAEPQIEGKILKIVAKEANDTGKERTATVTVVAGKDDNTATATLTVKQGLRDAESEKAVLKLEKPEVSFGSADGQSESVAFETNKPDNMSVAIEAGGEAWLKAEIQESAVVLSVLSANETTEIRKTVVTVTAGEGDNTASATISVSQSVSVPEGIAIGALYEGGMIVQIADDNTWVKIISLTESKEVWSTETIVTGLENNNDDGEGNTEILKALPNYASGAYPAAKFCGDLGDGWYMPSRKEWLVVADNTREQQEVINTYLTAYGGGILDFGSYYWVSNEKSDTQANCVRLKDKGQAQFNKSGARPVRGMKKIMISAE